MGDPMSVMIQLRYSMRIADSAFADAAVSPVFPLAGIAGLELDDSYRAVAIPRKEFRAPRLGSRVGEVFTLDSAPEVSTYVVRATAADEDALEKLLEAAKHHELVVGVFSDPRIGTFRVCPGDPPVGDDRDVANLLGLAELHEKGLDGKGVRVAVVDTGFNLDHLKLKGETPEFDAAASWCPLPDQTPGHLPVAHGTMCAYDVCISAPRCTLIDHALLLTETQGGSEMDGLVSDAVKSYSLLLQLLHPNDPDDAPLVVNNSWGMYNPNLDFPVGHPSNYSDNLNHPFNMIVSSLEVAGADILFAAGNCGLDCPAGYCSGFTDRTIYGANSHDSVLSVAGVDVTKDRVGYSSQGPGRLTDHKPDVSAYTHFRGSEYRPGKPDSGTSAACPVAAGVVAAIRANYPQSKIRPAVLRNLIRRTADDQGKMGFDYDYGYGIVNPLNLAKAIENL